MFAGNWRAAAVARSMSATSSYLTASLALCHDHSGSKFQLKGPRLRRRRRDRRPPGSVASSAAAVAPVRRRSRPRGARQRLQRERALTSR